jgi:DNA polymerase-1
MDAKALLKLLDNMDKPEQPAATFDRHSRVLVIDGLNLFLRNFAVLNYVNQEGVHIGGLGGFLRSLGFLISQNQPTSVYIVFDGVGSSLNRKNLLPEYKSGRNQTRMTNHDTFDDLDEEHDSKVNQISRLIHYLRCLPINLIMLDKVEADDIIAHLTRYLTEEYQSKCVIVSADKDFLQLVNNSITVYSPMIKEYYTPKTVEEKFGLHPENFILYKTLLGDSSDKIKGVQGLGPKKLFKLFPELTYQKMTLDDIFDVSEAKYKENVLYSKVVFDNEHLRKNYLIMDLSNPLVDDGEKKHIENIIEQPIEKTKSADFLRLYHEDGLNHVLSNAEYWIRDTFKVLNSFK